MCPPLQPRLAPPRNYQGLILATPFMSVKELRKILGKDAETLDEHNLSPLYSVIPPKNDSNEPSLSPLVPATGLEPARLAAYAPKAYVYTNFTTRATVLL